MAENSVDLRNIGSKAKQIVINVFNYFCRQPGADITEAMHHTAASTDVGLRTIYRLRKESKATNILSSPKRTRQRGPYKGIDEFDESVIRNKVHEFYTVRKQLPTIRSLHASLKEDIGYSCSTSSLRKTLIKLGFKWKKTNTNRKVLIEKPSVVSLRLQFYKRKQELEDIGYTLVYVDETWVDTACCSKMCWQGPSTQGLTPPINKGQRLIVVHAGSKDGFIPGAQLIYKATCSSGDYHKEMNGANFTKWLENQLIPNLDRPSAIVMDNASYHSMQLDKCPSSCTRKADIMDWLRRHKVTFKDTMLRTELLELARAHRPPPSYVIDELIRENGHEVLRLPPYHPDFNAIELIWSQLKSFVRRKNVTFRMDDLQRLAEEAFAEIGSDRWARVCGHVENVIKTAQKNDYYIDEQMDTFIIDLANDSESDSGDSGSSTDTASETE